MNNSEQDKVLMEIHGAVTTLASTVVRLDKQVNGNGQPGISQRLQTLEVSAKCYLKFAKAAFAASCTLGAALGWGLQFLFQFFWN